MNPVSAIDPIQVLLFLIIREQAVMSSRRPANSVAH